MLVAIYNCFL